MNKLLSSAYNDTIIESIAKLEQVIKKFEEDHNVAGAMILQFQVLEEKHPNGGLYCIVANVSFYEELKYTRDMQQEAAQVRDPNWIPGTNPPQLIHLAPIADMTGDPVYPET